MTFPFYLDFFGWQLHPHLVFEGLGYFLGARLYFSLRRRARATPLPLETNLWILVGCVFGAWAGSKLLAWAESPAHYLAVFRADPRGLLGGKTIVGGLLGGWAGVALAKRACRVVRSTGDLFVYPLALGTAVGRVGCFLTGLADRTYGVATTLPWGVDFGDHVARHPTQLYESLFVLAWALVLRLAAHRGRGFPPGALFRLYLAGYLAFRFLVEFIKPRELLLGPFSAIQLASLAGATLSLVTLRRPAPSIQNPQSKFKI